MPTQRHETTSLLLSARPRRQSAQDDVAVDLQTISTIHDTATSLSRQQRYCIRPCRGIKHPTPVDCYIHILAGPNKCWGKWKQLRYTLDCVSSHSLRAGGAMAMKLSSASDSTIMRIGRWTSLTYLTYIHSQIGALAKGVAWKMSQCFHFQNVS